MDVGAHVVGVDVESDELVIEDGAASEAGQQNAAGQPHIAGHPLGQR